MNKNCSKCGVLNEYKEFPTREDSPDGHRNTCKSCTKKYHRKWASGETIKTTYKDTTGKKQCRACLLVFDSGSFGKSNKNKDGLKSYCKMCNAKENAKWRKSNPEHNKKWREDNKKALKESDKRYREKNKEIIKAKNKLYVEKNKELVVASKKAWYEKNKKRILETKKERYKENREEIIAREQRYIKNSPTAMLRKKLRTRFYRAVKKGYKNGSAVRDLGCTIKELKKYFEDRFQQGMTWDNHGEWHIDHIIPLSSFDLTIREQVKKACHYTNLQPLWAEDNLKKGASLPKNKGDRKCQKM